MLVPPRSPRRRALAPLAAVAGMFVVACGGTDPFAPIANQTTQSAAFQVYALSTASSLLPTAMSLYAFQTARPAVRSNLSLTFDVAFDVDGAGRVRLLPPKLLVAPQSAPLVTGFQIVANTTFDALTRAPNSGYQYDSATVVSPGQVVAVQTQGAASAGVRCAIQTPMYAKLVVDSVRPAQGTSAVFFKVRVDQNCGFRSLEEGLPKS